MPKNTSHTYIIVTSIFMALAVVFYLIRLSVRPPLTPGFRVDDGIMMVATLGVVVFTSINFQAAHLGLGQDLWNVPPDNIDIVLKNFFIGEFLYIFISVLTKLAVLSFYLAVFPQPHFRKGAYVVIGLCIGYFVSYMFVLGFECTPVAFFWEQWRDPTAGTCININAGGWAAAGINIGLDLAILALPVPVILQLEISRQQKLQILSMFGVGSFVTVVSCIRLQSLINFAKNSNLTFYLQPISIWSSIELDISIVCACMPAARLFLQRTWPSRFGTSKSQAGAYTRQPSTFDAPHHQSQLSGRLARDYSVKSANANVSQPRWDNNDVELMESDGWRGASRTCAAYVPTTDARHY
ncbi:hypothetical protein, variant 3 [Cladophialophora immunda]|nr:hypothetical protein, variant 1 [Cladophialophora immunda]XP_016244547.1 hypothetical protein, variant 2 [Cladophialophora immunda]XP_016244548.1 hypothetical protein, variant 3 [Cladophialophora immunda]KIW24330.1 hypothetical protein, variant 1 [Cladophialophora immunda]KIW24331.1 hypothetical protein, variant 2 [Cladophialophora immunda]KIW24332.1 hypothetical protein, variant 3 [Cladophialophora immunda]OQU97889.1 hypothetical protein CLAIMM_03759 isoform 2 [Cladophialophora immunda]